MFEGIINVELNSVHVDNLVAGELRIESKRRDGMVVLSRFLGFSDKKRIKTNKLPDWAH